MHKKPENVKTSVMKMEYGGGRSGISINFYNAKNADFAVAAHTF